MGTKKGKVSLENFPQTRSTFTDVMEDGRKTLNGEFAKKLFKKYKPEELYGKAIKDKRGGDRIVGILA